MRFTGVYVVGAKADFAKSSLRITLSVPLSAALEWRDKIAGWVVLESPVTVSIDSTQPHLPGLSPGISSVTLSAGDKSVTMSPERFHAAAQDIAGGSDGRIDEDGVIHDEPLTAEEIRAELD